MLTVYQNLSPRFGRGIQRVAAALTLHAPASIQFVNHMEDANLIVHHVIGVRNFHDTLDINHLIAATPNHVHHAVVQYCLSTTENPNPRWWHDSVWRYCDVVWSYYDLEELLYKADRLEDDPRFYHAPLGVDKVFHGSLADRPTSPIYMVCTSGHIPETEGVLECVEAAARVGGRVLHLGPKSLMLGPHVSYVENMTDGQLATLYKSCKYVAGLRRVEGFELPAAEGLCGGAIPICFDQPHYRRWFEEAALYVPEEGPLHVRESIEQIFRYGTRKLDPADVVLAQRKFSWPRVVDGFWRRILTPKDLSPADALPDDDIPF